MMAGASGVTQIVPILASYSVLSEANRVKLILVHLLSSGWPVIGVGEHRRCLGSDAQREDERR